MNTKSIPKLLFCLAIFAGFTQALLFGMSKKGKSQDEVIFVMNNGTEPQSLDPHKISGVPEHRVYRAFFQPLITYDVKTAREAVGVAESWSNEGTVYTLKLRKDAVWSDGVPITAQTVYDSWIRSLNPETASRYAWFPGMLIKGAEDYTAGKSTAEDVAIEVVDDTTFRFETVGELPYVIGALAHYSFAVVPIHAIEKYGNNWTKPENFVGNGPFVLEQWSPQEIIVGTKNETFWNKENVFIDRIEMLPIEDDNTAFNMYENDEVDWITGVPTEQFDNLRGREDFYVAPQLTTYYYLINNTKAPYDDARVRKALALSIGRKDIAEKVLGQGQIPAYGIVPPMEGYSPIEEMREDEQKAKALLAEAGFPGGKGFPTITVLYNTNEAHKKIAAFVQQRWSTILGIKVELENQEWKTYLATRREHNFDVARAAWVGDYLDPNTFLDMFISGGGLNDGDYSSAEYDKLIKLAATQNGSQRMATLRKAEDLLINQDASLIPIYYYVSMNLFRSDRWDGWYVNTLDTHGYEGIRPKK